MDFQNLQLPAAHILFLAMAAATALFMEVLAALADHILRLVEQVALVVQQLVAHMVG